MPDIPNQLAVVQAVRAQYPTPLGARHAAFLIDVARACKMGLHKKTFGTHVVLPDGQGVSQDCLVDKTTLLVVDILADGEGAASPTWDVIGIINDPANYYEVSGQPVPDPQPNPQPQPNPDIAALKLQVIALRDELQAVKQLVVSLITEVDGCREDARQAKTQAAKAIELAQMPHEIDPSKYQARGKVDLFGIVSKTVVLPLERKSS